MKHRRVLIADLAEQIGEHIIAAARRAHRRRSRRVSGPWDAAANRDEHSLAPPPDDGPAPEQQTLGDHR